MDTEYNKPPRRRERVPRNTGEQSKRKTPHEDYLAECFRQQIRLPLEDPQKITIYSWRDKIVAHGYQRVVITWQGMYYELTEQQVEWANFQNKTTTVGGDYKWSDDGISLYNPIRERPSAAVVRHRFAILPPRGGCRRPLRTDRYYVHVYQTKIGRQRRTLHSKRIATELERKYGKSYYPRELDRTKQSEIIWRRREPTKTQSSKGRKQTNNMDPEDTVRKKHERERWNQRRGIGENSKRPLQNYGDELADRQWRDDKTQKRWRNRGWHDEKPYRSSTSRMIGIVQNMANLSSELAKCLEGSW